jgi:hypothetical protein
MPLTKYDDMVKAVASDRADKPFTISTMAVAARLDDPGCPSPEVISDGVLFGKAAVVLAVYMQFRPWQGAQEGYNSSTGFPGRLSGYGILGPNVGLIGSPTAVRCAGISGPNPRAITHTPRRPGPFRGTPNTTNPNRSE